MSIVSLAELRSARRELTDSLHDPNEQAALDAAQEYVEGQIGFQLTEFDADVPTTIRNATIAVALVGTGFFDLAHEQDVLGRVDRGLRVYRREPSREATI